MNQEIICPSGSLRYIWRTGDTVQRVATTFGTTVSAMIDLNANVNFDTITAGEAVCIPSRLLTCPDADLYVIQQGDTYASIAAALGVTVGAITDLNPYVDPTRLAIGQIICVPRPAPEEDEGVTDGETGGVTDGEEECVQADQAPDLCETLRARGACSAFDTVGCGQTLADILAKYGMSYAEFACLNPKLSLAALVPGQRYRYPLKTCRCDEDGAYTLRNGDTLASVAAAFGLTASELLRRNPHLTPAEFVAGAEICVRYREPAETNAQ